MILGTDILNRRDVYTSVGVGPILETHSNASDRYRVEIINSEKHLSIIDVRGPVEIRGNE